MTAMITASGCTARSRAPSLGIGHRHGQGQRGVGHRRVNLRTFTKHTTRRAKTAAIVPAIDYVAELDSATAQTLIYVLKPALTVYTLLMIVRIVMTWSPELSGNDFPWSVAFKSTEGLLDPTRKVIKPFNGLDVSPIVWVALLSFISEILTGPQGILNLIVRKGI